MATHPPPRLIEISEQLKQKEPVSSETVRTFLSWFGAERRGRNIVERIRSTLDRLAIATEPDFESAYIDSHIAFARAQPSGPVQPGHVQLSGLVVMTPPLGKGTLTVSVQAVDPTYRISKLKAANTVPVSVKPDAPLAQAITLMLAHDFSQLPVMVNERDVKGAISWKSIGSRLALNRPAGVVRECMVPAPEVASDSSIFAAIDTIIDNDFALVRRSDRAITGIVTTADLSLQFEELGAPFLLVGEIENHIRRLIRPRFSAQELSECREPTDTSRTIETVDDLTFGEYIRLLEDPNRWIKLDLALDRGVFVEQLKRVRDIRNDAMHFDPDGVPDSDLKTLRDFAQFLRELQAAGVE